MTVTDASRGTRCATVGRAWPRPPPKGHAALAQLVGHALLQSLQPVVVVVCCGCLSGSLQPQLLGLLERVVGYVSVSRSGGRKVRVRAQNARRKRHRHRIVSRLPSRCDCRAVELVGRDGRWQGDARPAAFLPRRPPLGLVLLLAAPAPAAALLDSPAADGGDGGGRSVAPAPGPAACGDAAADNYDPGSTAVRPGDNRACAYSCTGLRTHFTLFPTASACYISGGDNKEWPPAPVEPLQRRAGSSCSRTSDCEAGQYCIMHEYCSAGNNTFTVSSWGVVKVVIIQGYALGGGGRALALVGRTALASRADAIGVGATLVLRHVSMAGLVAVDQPSIDSSGYSFGGAVHVYQGVLTRALCRQRGFLCERQHPSHS